MNEHLDFFARLKGVTDWREEGARLLELLLLKDKANTVRLTLNNNNKFGSALFGSFWRNEAEAVHRYGFDR